MLYSAGGFNIRACISASADTSLEVLFEGCASMLIREGVGGAIYTEYPIKIMYQVPHLGHPVLAMLSTVITFVILM